MAGVLLNVTSGEVALTASTAKSVLQIKAPANQRLLVSTIRIFGKAPAGGVDVPVKVRVTRSTASFGTGTAVTPAKNDPTDDETPQSTAAANFSAEPVSTDSFLLWEMQPQTGVIEFLPPGQEIKVPGGQSIQIEMTAAAAQTVVATLGYQE